MIKTELQDIQKLKDKIFSRLTIDYNNQNLQSQLDDIDYIAIKLKSELSNWKTLNKNWKEQLTVNAMLDRMMKENVRYSYIKKGRKLYYEAPSTSEFKEYMRIIEDDYFKKLEFYDLKKRFKNYQHEISALKKFGVLIYTKGFLRDFYRFSNDDNCRELIDLYILCLGKANNNIRENKDMIYKLLDKIFDNLKIDYSLEDQQIVKYINQKVRWRCLDLYTHNKENYRRKRQEEIYIIEEEIGRSKDFILCNWFGFDTREVLTNTDILNLKYLTKSQKQFIIDTLEIVRKNRNNIKYHRNINSEPDISKAWVCNLLETDYNSFKNKIKRIKNKNKKQGIEPFNNYLYEIENPKETEENEKEKTIAYYKFYPYEV